MTTSSTTIISILQLAVSPAIMISAVGLILLTLNNQLAYSVNRLRLLMKETETASGEEKKKINSQIRIIYRRAKITRWSIILLILSAFFSTSLIISLFITALLGLNDAWVYIIFFLGALSCLALGLILFIWEVNDGLLALHIDFN